MKITGNPFRVNSSVNPVMTAPGRTPTDPQSSGQDSFTVRFQGQGEAAAAAGNAKPSAPIIPDNSAKPLPELAQGSQMILGSVSNSLHPGQNIKQFWPIALMTFCTMDPNVRKYLEDQQIKPESIYLALEALVAKKLGKRQHEMTPGVMQQIVTSAKEFTRNEGGELVTPIELWRWLMKTDPNEHLETIMKSAGFDDRMIGRIRKAPPVKKPLHARSGRPDKEVITRLDNAMEVLPKKILGQEKGLTRMIMNIQTAMLDYQTESNPNRPASITIILGPSGVGKTLTADELSKSLGCSTIYEQMNQYKDGQNAAKLTGAAPGYVGYGEGGSFSDNVIKANEATQQFGTPPPIVVFDEIEKADAKVFDVLMQVFDRGELPNGTGQVATFGGTHIILTSNVGQDRIREAIQAGATDEEVLEIAKDALQQPGTQGFQGFRPEFLGRINSVIVYENLSREDCGQILDKEIRELKQAILREDGFELEISPEVRDYILERGYNEKTGARELKNFLRASLRTLLIAERKKLIFNDLLPPEGVQQGKMIATLQGDPPDIHLEFQKDAPPATPASETPSAS